MSESVINSVNSENLQYSKEMMRNYPQAVDVEKSILGALILEQDTILDVINILSVDNFYTFANREVYRAILTLFESHCPIDIMTVINQLKKNGVLEQIGGESYVISLIERVVSGANIQYHSFLILEYSIKENL